MFVPNDSTKPRRGEIIGPGLNIQKQPGNPIPFKIKKKETPIVITSATTCKPSINALAMQRAHIAKNK
jgi:hypothetical protein